MFIGTINEKLHKSTHKERKNTRQDMSTDQNSSGAVAKP
jgi:hypothetical protein